MSPSPSKRRRIARQIFNPDDPDDMDTIRDMLFADDEDEDDPDEVEPSDSEYDTESLESDSDSELEMEDVIATFTSSESRPGPPAPPSPPPLPTSTPTHDSPLSRSATPPPQPSTSSQHQETPRNMNVTWDWIPAVNYVPSVLNFDDIHAGIQPECPITEDSREIEYFEMFFDGELMKLLVSETNKYHMHTLRRGPMSTSRRKHWKDTDEKELYIFIALSILMPHTYKGNQNEYWSTDPLIETPVFGKTMSRDRYLLLLRTLHFADNDLGGSQEDSLWKIRPVMSHLLQRYKKYFHPFRKLVIDESLLLYKGRLRFKQYIPSKRHRFGVKLFVLCDCETGYILDIIVYIGKGTISQPDPLGFSGSIVKKLLEDYLGKGHTLYTDNYYTSPMLSQWLKENNLASCGTVRPNRKHMPLFPKVAKGEQRAYTANEMLCVKWHDKRDVHMLTNVNENKFVNTEREDYRTGEMIVKPDSVNDYNENMRLIDKSDMQIGIVETTRKSVKWYRKLFFHMVDVTILNAYNFYLVKTGKKPGLKKFCLSVIRQLISKYGQIQRQRPGGRRYSEEIPAPARILNNHHYIEFIPPTEKKKNPQRACHVCAHSTRKPKKRKDTRFMCSECNVSLCINPCFKDYHTLVEY